MTESVPLRTDGPHSPELTMGNDRRANYPTRPCAYCEAPYRERPTVRTCSRQCGARLRQQQNPQMAAPYERSPLASRLHASDGEKEVPLYGVKAAGRVALVDESDYGTVAPYRWWVLDVPAKNFGPYAMARIGYGRNAPQRYMHALLTGWPRTDHVNHNGLDNTRKNLRPATAAQNLANSRPRREGASRYKGVSPHCGRWRARIKVAGEVILLGTHDTELDAALAYDIAARHYYGEFACRNYPEGYKAMGDFYMDGPHSPESMKGAADLVAEGIRYLNRATMPGSGGLEYPGDVYELLASLHIAVSRMPQMLAQAASFLRSRFLAGEFAVTGGGDPDSVTATAVVCLNEALELAGGLAAEIRAAQNAIAGLGAKED